MADNQKLLTYLAAGGVVMNATADQVLLLIRPSRDEVRLPKGHIEPGESPSDAALREVAEESGYTDLQVTADLGEQLVAFTNEGRAVLRTEHYFLITAASQLQVERPVLDEEQFLTIWVSWDETAAHLTYEAEREWINRARQALARKWLNMGETIREIHIRLAHAYGNDQDPPSGKPIDTLVNTILSQNTNDVNRDIAFQRLRACYPSWEAVRDAPLDAVMDAIRPAGLAPSKAPHIQAALQKITEERGTLELDFLAAMGRDAARDWLLSLDGVGPKTAAIVLLFALGIPAFPVDTHVHRVTRRLGLIPDDTNREKAHVLLEAIIPPEMYHLFHINIIAHGRRVCHARTPKCSTCTLRDLCRYATDGFAPGSQTTSG